MPLLLMDRAGLHWFMANSSASKVAYGASLDEVCLLQCDNRPKSSSEFFKLA